MAKHKRPPEQKKNGCSVGGCDRGGRLVRGYCMTHYDRWRKYGDPLGGQTFKGEPARYLEEVVVGHAGADCLTWPYARLTNGYPSIHIGGRAQIVSRLVCERRHGAPPSPRHEAAHSCGNGHLGCVNPLHLDWKTPEANQADRVLHGTSNRGERQWMSKLRPDDVRAIRSRLGTETNTEIAEDFGVNAAAIRGIRIGTTWAWLDAEPAKEMAQ